MEGKMGWVEEDPKEIRIFSEGAKEGSIKAWEREEASKWGTYPAISVIRNIGGGYNVQFYGVNRNRIKSFDTKREAIEYAEEWIRQH